MYGLSIDMDINKLTCDNKNKILESILKSIDALVIKYEITKTKDLIIFDTHIDPLSTLYKFLRDLYKIEYFIDAILKVEIITILKTETIPSKTFKELF